MKLKSILLLLILTMPAAFAEQNTSECTNLNLNHWDHHATGRPAQRVVAPQIPDVTTASIFEEVFQDPTKVLRFYVPNDWNMGQMRARVTRNVLKLRVSLSPLPLVSVVGTLDMAISRCTFTSTAESRPAQCNRIILNVQRADGDLSEVISAMAVDFCHIERAAGESVVRTDTIHIAKGRRYNDNHGEDAAKLLVEQSHPLVTAFVKRYRQIRTAHYEAQRAAASATHTAEEEATAEQ